MNNHPSLANEAAQPDRRIAVGIGLLLAAVYLATGAFHFFAVDEISSFALTRSLLTHAATDTDILAWVEPLMAQYSVTATGIDGHVYSLKDIAPSVLMAPLAWLGSVSGVSPVRAVYLLPILVTAITGGLLYLMIRDQGYRQRTAILGSLVFGLASMAFPYAKVIFSQPVAALGLLIALWAALRAGGSQRPGPAFLSGIGLGLAGLSATPTWITAPVILACLAFRWESPGGLRWVKSRKTIGLMAAWGAGAGLFIAAQAIYNAARFGSPLETGHSLIGAGMSLTTVGLASWAQLVSTPRGVVWFAPFVVLIPFSLAIGRRGPKLGLQIACLAMSLLVWLVYSAFFNWSAGLSFGPRYLSMVMPMLALATLPLLDSFLDQMKLWQRALVAGILALSALTQLGGSLLDYSRAEDLMREVLGRFTPPPSFFAWSPEFFSPAHLVQAHLWTALQNGWWDVLWMSRGTPDWPLLGAEIALIALAVACLALAARGTSARTTRLLLAGQAVLTVALAAWAIGRYPRPAGYSRAETPPPPGLDAAIARLGQSARRGDGAIVTLFLEESLAWLESPHLGPPDIGLPLEAPLRDSTARLVSHGPEWYDRVWVVSQGGMPGDPQNGIAAWLSERAFAGAEIDVEGYRLSPFAFSAGEMSLQPVGQSFGGQSIRLVGYASQFGGPDGRAWLNVWLRWEAQKPPAQSQTVFVHLLDPSGALVSQHDGVPQAGYAPTQTWQPGAPVDDRHSLALPDPLPPGDYTLVVGLYDSISGEPLPLDGSPVSGLVLGTLTVEPGP